MTMPESANVRNDEFSLDAVVVGVATHVEAARVR